MRQGRFEQGLDAAMRSLNASIGYDRRLHAEDIEGSRAWAAALETAGLLSADERQQIEKGLDEIGREIREGAFEFSEELEDIHMNIEARLIERIGPAGARLHTGRSRNDQVATDLRLYLRRACDATIESIEALLGAVLDTAEREFGVIIPAYTHLQRAQPVLFSHHLMAYAEMLLRDRRRFLRAREEADVCPLGSGACAGNQFNLDREALRENLGFSALTHNSMDAVSDRDFVVEYLHAAVLLTTHLSRFSEDLILWCSSEFGLVHLDDAVTTGSSMLPQKRNPDAAELARGKCGRLIGHLTGLLTTLKGLPLTYNKDLQEDKEPVFDAIDTLELILPVFRVMIETLRVDRDRASRLLEGGFLDATALADYLTRRGVPFREAHDHVGRVVRECEGRGLDLASLPLEDYRKISDQFEADLFEAIALEATVADKQVIGGTAPARVREEIARVREILAS